MINALLLTLVLFTCSKPEAERPANDPKITTESNAFATQMLAEVNALRASGCRCGGRWMPPTPPLRWNGLLTRAAQRHANDMHNNDFFNHRGSDGSDMSGRVSEAGYAWRAVAENIAWGYSDVTAVVQGWKDSPGHCENMMSGDYTEMGGAQAGRYWVQDLGRR